MSDDKVYAVPVDEAVRRLDVISDYDAGNGPEPCVHRDSQVMSPRKAVEKERKDDGIRPVSHLTAPERETVINASDADGTIQIWTAQRKVLTKLRKNPAATLVDWGKYGTTVWASFTLPYRCLNVWSSVPRLAKEIHLRESLDKAQAGDLSPVSPANASVSGKPQPMGPDEPSGGEIWPCVST